MIFCCCDTPTLCFARTELTGGNAGYIFYRILFNPRGFSKSLLSRVFDNSFSARRILFRWNGFENEKIKYSQTIGGITTFHFFSKSEELLLRNYILSFMPSLISPDLVPLPMRLYKYYVRPGDSTEDEDGSIYSTIEDLDILALTLSHSMTPFSDVFPPPLNDFAPGSHQFYMT